MKTKVGYNEVMFYNEDSNKKYIKYLKNKIENNHKNKDDLNEEYKLALITGKYVDNMLIGVCDNCEIQYSINSYSLVWICPCCGRITLSDKMSAKQLCRKISL